jgi:hypothetical protein
MGPAALLPLRQLVSGVSPQRPTFDPTRVHVRLAADSVSSQTTLPVHWVFPRQYHSTNAPRSSLSTYSSYQKEKRAKPGNLPKSSALSAIGQHCIEKHYSLFVTARLFCSAALRTVHLSSPYLVNLGTRYLASTLALPEG